MTIISVIIPTHNRAKYAIPTIKSVLEISGELEVVVTDTSDKDEISCAFPDVDGRLKIIRPGEKLNVVENFELGIKNSCGDYLIFIGDDDLVVDWIVELAYWAKNNRVDALKTTLPAHYYWPDFKHKRRGDHYSGTVHINKFTGSIREIDAVAAMEAAADDLGGGVLLMPRAYVGIVSRDLVDGIVKKYGNFFGGVSPDIYSAALISKEARCCIELDYPVIVPGSSGASTAGQSASGGHVGGLRDNAHIGAFKDLTWDPLVPEFYSVPTVWSYSFIKALEKIDGGIELANFPRLYVRCLLYHRAYRKQTIESIKFFQKNNGKYNTIVMIFKSFLREIIWIIKRIYGNLIGMADLSDTEVLCDIEDSSAARRRVLDYLHSRPLILKSL